MTHDLDKNNVNRIIALTDFGSTNTCSWIDVDAVGRLDFVEARSSVIFVVDSGNTNPSTSCDFGERFLYPKKEEKKIYIHNSLVPYDFFGTRE